MFCDILQHSQFTDSPPCPPKMQFLISRQDSYAICKCLEIFKTSWEQVWNGGSKGLAGYFPERRGCPSLETMHLVSLQIREKPPLPPHFQKSLIPRREAQYRFTFSDKWDSINEILIDTFCFEYHIWRILIAWNGAEETFVSKRNLILQWNGDQTPNIDRAPNFLILLSDNLTKDFY